MRRPNTVFLIFETATKRQSHNLMISKVLFKEIFSIFALDIFTIRSIESCGLFLVFGVISND